MAVRCTRKFFWAPLGVFLVAVSLFPVLMGICWSSAAPPLSPGAKAPEFELENLDGKKVGLSDLRGRPVFIHFWATWCEICKEEMPLLDDFYRAHREEISILGLNLAEPRKRVERYVRKQALDFPILLDPRGRVASEYSVLGLPSTILVDAEGRIVTSMLMGALSREALERHLRSLVGSTPED